MTARILPQAVALSLLVCAARADDVKADPAIAPDTEIAAEVTTVDLVAEPVIIACVGLPTVDEVTLVDPAGEPVVFVCPGVVTEDPVGDPIVTVCPFPGTEDDTAVIKPDAGEPEVAICEGVDGEVIEVVDIRHYTGSEVERGDGEVDPTLIYATGVNTLGGPATGEVNLDPGISVAGIETIPALKLDIADRTAPARELKVFAAAGDIIISD